MPNKITSLSITDDTLKTVLEKYISDCKEKEDVVKLLLGCIAESSVTSSKLVALALGVGLPAIPPVGTVGYIKIEKLSWGFDKTVYEKSVYNSNGYIPCTVKSFTGHHRYSPLTVILPKLEHDTDEVNHSIDLEDFFTEPLSDDIVCELPF